MTDQHQAPGAGLTAYPVTFEMDYSETRSRLTTFFRWILATPHFLFAAGYALVFYVVYVIAWVTLLITARWPAGLYKFMGGFLRYLTRLNAYLFLGVDNYPPFTAPRTTAIPSACASRHRSLNTAESSLFRGIYAIFAMVIRYALGIVLSFVSFLSWFAIVATGRQPESLQNALNFALSYTTQADALMFLITETYPPFGQSDVPSTQPAI